MKEVLRRYIPDKEKLANIRSLNYLGTAIYQPQLWRFNRRSVTRACAVGFFFMWIPLPIQMLLAALCAVWLHANLPLSIVIVWITNPLTIIPMYTGAYLFGCWVLNTETMRINFNIDMVWIQTTLLDIWPPFLIGCFLLAIGNAIAGYVSVDLFWRYHISRQHKRRRLDRRD